MCRGAIEINRLHWEGNKVEVAMTSVKNQEITIVLPRGIAAISGEAAATDGANPAERKVILSGGERISLSITLE